MRAGILHRDLSLSNIMYRIVEEESEAGVVEKKVHGVLTDFDLASFTEDLKKDYAKTSQQRTGTPPFMAHELLDGSDTLHLYRHDLESLFYVMLILATHYEIQLPTEEEGGLRMRRGLKGLPYQKWFDQPSYETLASLKHTFFSNRKRLNLSPDFEDFRDWLGGLRLAFRLGFRTKETDEDVLITLQHSQDDGSEDEAVEFDDETLGGRVDYSALINPVRRLKGELEGLIIRYDPPPSSTSTAKTDG